MPDSAHYAIAAVVFDWAGTTVDHGSLAPVRTLQRVFEGRGIHLPDEVARHDMGIAKRDHIRSLLSEPVVQSAWRERYGRADAAADTEELYQEFIPLQMACLLDFAQLIEGICPLVATLRSRGVRIGGTTGYTRPMLEALEQAARTQGYATDLSLCPEDVGAGRPLPFMCYELAVRLKVAPLSACVKIGDTASDIEEGRQAGMWTIAVLRSGNLVGLSAHDWRVLPEPEKQAAIERAQAVARQHHAHYAIETVADALPVLDQIAARIDGGEKP